MQLAVLSDLHLGRKNNLDRFARKHDHIEPRFLELLSHLEKHVDKIVLLGDIFETLKSTPGSAEKELRAVLATYPELAKRFTENPKYQLVHGNHDIVAKKVLGTPEYLELEDHRTKLCFFHGHQLDRLTQGLQWTSRVALWAAGMLETIGFCVTPEDMHPERDGPLRKKHELFKRAALQRGRQRGADVVITGHTHRAIRIEESGQLFMNSGTCVAGRREMLLLDTARASFEVIFEPDLAGAVA